MVKVPFPLSMHMAVDILLLLVCGPLIVAALPTKWGRLSEVRRFSKFLSEKIWVPWMIGSATMWLSHVPSIHHLAMIATNVHSLFGALLALALVAAGMLFSWPLIGPNARHRIHPLHGILYLAAACISCSLMGLLITFAPAGTYHGVTKQDMQTAGLIMWIPGCLIYLSGCLVLLREWLREGITNNEM